MLAGAVSPQAAMARTVVAVGVGVPFPGWYGPPAYVVPPPTYVYAAPTPVYPAPVYVVPPAYEAPPPVQGPAPAQSWYYCDNPQGYYPYVSNCNNAWRQVAPTPAK